MEIFEVSAASIADLNSLQADTFILATPNFNALAGGTSFLTISNLTLGDADGNPLSAAAGTGSITVTRGLVTPEPSALSLLGIGFLGLMVSQRWKGVV